MVEYTLIFKNNSSNPGHGCVFQKDPDVNLPDVMSLAWFSKYTHPTTVQTFKWQINYDFVWAETGKLQAGVVFSTAQIWDANLSTTNKVTLTNQGGAYTFKDQTQGSLQGNLYIWEDNTIPLKQASVGIGMSGAGVFAVQAQPNMNLVFRPHPKYWIAFGNYMPGEVLDISMMTNDAVIEFPPNVYSMTAILHKNNKFTVEPTSNVNEKFLKEMESGGADIEWGGDK